jgi:adenylate cyclase
MRRIAAWAIDSGETNVDFVSLFYHHVVALKKRRVVRNYAALAEMIEEVLETSPLDVNHPLVAGMIEQHGYCGECALEALSSLLGGRLRHALADD